MYPSNSDSLLATASTLLDKAKNTNGVDQQCLVELQQVISALVDVAFATDDWMSASDNGRTIESLLNMTDFMLTARSESQLFECGVRTISLILRQMPFGVAQICSQEKSLASVCGMRILDLCMAKLVDSCDGAEKLLGTCITKLTDEPSYPDDNVTAALDMSLICVESFGNSIEALSPGEDGLLKSSAIWSSTLEGTNATASYLVRAFECACLLFLRCTNTALRKRPKCAAFSSSLYKASGKLIDLVSAIFSSDVHVSGDTGRKRSLMEKFCLHALGIHKSIMNSPPQFKMVWKALCVISTSSLSISFEGSELCLKVYIQSTDTVRVLVKQAVTILQRAEGLNEEKTRRRFKGILAFIRFIVFQMPSLLSKIRKTAGIDRGDSGEVIPAAMSMLDVIFGELALAQLQVSMPYEISTMIQQLVSTVSVKFTVSLLTCYMEPILRYMGLLQDFFCTTGLSSDTNRTKCHLLDGIQNASANREIMRIVVANINGFTPEQQEKLLTHNVPIPMAFAMAIDYDAASVFSISKGVDWIHPEQQKSTSEYEQLVCSAALCAANVATPKLYGQWEMAALQTMLQAPLGSLGAQIIVDAWGVLATRMLPQRAVLATIKGVLDVVVTDPQRVGKVGSRLVRRLLRQLFSACAEDGLSGCLSPIIKQVVEESLPDKMAFLCEIVPWSLYGSGSMIYDIGRTLAINVSTLLETSGTIKEKVAIINGLAALLPLYRIGEGVIDLDSIWQGVWSIFDKALCQDTDVVYTDRLWAVESVLSLSAQLPEEENKRIVMLLGHCARNLKNTLFKEDTVGLHLIQLVASFAAVDLSHPSMKTVLINLRQIFEHLLKEDMSWLVIHQVHLLVIRLATDSVNQSVAETLVPKTLQAPLLQFIQREPAGEKMDSIEEREAMYRSVFGIIGWQRSYMALPNDQSGHITSRNGRSLRDLEQLVNAIVALRQQLEGALHERILPGPDSAMRTELARLVEIIEKFPHN
ncbi:hypothetical protein COEREDRAFT_83286 [Coemansia reversa NRRL 1564]|uniref:Uncharacterized protein n=1 Tax=Coemansia reversa (strain ATCC 12441 / NRRL 1564) TaxID=763665 RepID=A0A2G5B3U6_COERN|nr:hypothetical protein COEREDRAFT_83286 [Coemansia reversa NRRL 1564]|eukprot:PIA13686.1 hypothetical protein COEREDRAFT_83286 [Coemansia reversa NRRL 1564]